MTSSTAKGTYFYSPDVKIFVKSSTVFDAAGNPSILDLSEDIMSFSVSRQSNATSTAQFTLANKGWKYTVPPANIGGATSLPIETMDQVVIYLKKEKYLQYFTGYITNAPILTLIPQPVTFQASCTIYKIQNSFWDINNPAFQSLMPGMLMAATSGTLTTSGMEGFVDGGAAQGIVNVLSNVVGIPLNSIHVTAIPPTWIANSAQTYNLLYNPSDSNNRYLPQNGAETLMRALDGAGIISSNNLINQTINGQPGYVTYSGLSSQQIQAVAIPNGTLTNAVMAPEGATLYTIPGGSSGIIAKDVKLKDIYNRYSGGSPKPQPVPINKADPEYWCVISWPYFVQNFDERTTADAAQWLSGSSVGWGNGRPIVVTSIANARQIVVKATIAGDTGNNIVLSRAAWEYLAGSPVTYNVGSHSTSDGTSSTGDFYFSDSVQVTLTWADPTKVNQGPLDNTNLVTQLENYGFSLGQTLAQGSSSLTITSSGNATYAQLTDPNSSTTTTRVTSNAGNPGGPPTNRTPIHPFTINNSSDWAALCLRYGGFPVTPTNIALINLWITLENADGWAEYYNPLGDTDSNLASKYGSGGTGSAAFQSLDIAAQWWGYKMNTRLYWEIGAVFDSKPRYSNGTYKPSSKNDVPLKSANIPGAPKNLGTIISKIFKPAVQACPWDGAHYRNKEAGTWTEGSTRPRALLNPGIAAPKPYGSWGTSTSTSTSHNPSTGTTTTITNTGGNFNINFNPPQVDQNTLALIGTPRAFVTDQPVLQSISTLVQSSLRNFQSAPNGDFLAWFPDYFGLYGQAPALGIHDIEIIDFSIYHDDTQLATHIAVSGDPINMGTSVNLVDWMQTNGIISVQIPEIMAILFGFASSSSTNSTQAALDSMTAKLGKNFANAFLTRYGLRPLVQEQPMIRSHVTEFMYAWQLFMESWANQYSSEITLTFMPELYPGMRIRLQDHGIEVYVQGVQHQGDRTGGFQTSAMVTCPVYRKNASDINGVKLLHYGYPIAGSYGS
jgi:hypothetical protein